MRRNPFPIGVRFGRLVVLSVERHDKSRGAYFMLCACDCGGKTVVREDCLKSGNTKSCGCLAFDSPKKAGTHGMHKSRTYRIWAGMRDRCTNVHSKKAHLYALKGVKLYGPWNDFVNFLNDMGEAPDGYSIERIDGGGNYEPKNCRWATPKEQGNNTTKNKRLTYADKTMTISQWADELNIKPNTLVYRIRRGWSTSRAINTPIQNHQKGTAA